MKNRNIAILISLVLLLVVGVLYLYQKNKPADWTPTFINFDKKPFGTYISYNLLKDAFPEAEKIRSTRKYPYNELESGTNRKNITSYIFINLTFEVTDLDLRYLIDYVQEGGNVFIAAENIDENLLDTLSLKMNERAYINIADSIDYLTAYPQKEYKIGSVYSKPTFKNLDKVPHRCKVLGQSCSKEANFVQILYGKGHFYLSTRPAAFTNVSQIDTALYDYAYRCLSYLPNQGNVVWDESQKEYPFDFTEDSLFKIIRRYEPLLMALYITIVGILLFMLFRSKRTQRVIPTIVPPKNSSLEFLDTISNLYYVHEDCKSIAEYRYNFFLDAIRHRYYLKTEHIDDEFIKYLSAKSGVDTIIVERIFELYRYIKNHSNISNHTLIQFNDALEEFYTKSS